MECPVCKARFELLHAVFCPKCGASLQGAPPIGAGQNPVFNAMPFDNQSDFSNTNPGHAPSPMYQQPKL